jgi:hypothetical protein
MSIETQPVPQDENERMRSSALRKRVGGILLFCLKRERERERERMKVHLFFLKKQTNKRRF